MTVTIWHNPKCGTSRNVLAMIRATGVEPVIIEYLKTPPDAATLARVAAAVGGAAALLRVRGAPAEAMGLVGADDAAILAAMAREPVLIERPVVITPKATILARPSEAVLAVLDGALPADFRKEDGTPVVGGVMTRPATPVGGGMIVRPGAPADAEAIAAIYAPQVLHGTASFETVAPTNAEMAARIARVVDAGWPWLVTEAEGAIIGYAYAAQFRDRAAYAATCENSVYVAADAHRRGTGTALLQALIAAARDAGFREMIAVIGDGSGNVASRRLHAACGFRDVGMLTNVGNKFGRWLDVAYMQRSL